jgi:pimeloyl-ACP methyl ester carboxylesterase
MTMATYVLIHGAGDVGWYWHLVERDLRARGHDVVAPNLPCEDDSAGLVAPMIPAPGEAPADYWSNTRYGDEVRESYDDEIALFYQDVPPELAAEALERGRPQSEARMYEPSPLKTWPDVPTRVVLCRDDRLFPPSFVRRVAEERLGITPDEIDGGHTPALSRPKELAELLEAYRVSIVRREPRPSNRR